MNKICLASENYTPVHPLIMEGIIAANNGPAPAYGGDRFTEEAEKLVHTLFESKPKVLFVPTGTGANVLVLKLACRAHESVICSDIAHLYYQESGAPEAVVGCKLLPVSHRGGKLFPEDILRKLKNERAFGKHTTSPRVLSITQPTELGTVYSQAELNALHKLCKEEGLLFHIDGSRIYNAIVSMKTTFPKMFNSIGVDLLSLGGTKNGLMCAEALLIFNPALEVGADHLQKQTLQLLSKMRYMTAQFIPFLKTELWQKLAQHANQKAQEIVQLIEKVPQLKISYPVETNQIFITAKPEILEHLHKTLQILSWDEERHEVRMIASWNTTDADIEGVRKTLAEIK